MNGAVRRVAPVILSLALLVFPPPAAGLAAAEDQKPAAEGQKASTFAAAQLEQIVAPIALYPDALLMQILMASTYPLEIVEAHRWAQKNPSLKGKDLEEALKKQDWDASVKSLCGFPDVLKRLNENLDWTQDLGDAFLGQKTEILDTVQKMRGKALEAGQLKTTEQQKVTQQADKIIVIESASPEVIYVPTYSPTVVYGAWSYPTYYYPPMYAPVPPGYGAMMFTVGIVWGAAIWGGCAWGWGHSTVNVNVNNYNNFNNNTNISGGNRNQINTGGGGKQDWDHNPEHRGGVNYKDNATAKQYGGSGNSNRVSNDQARGYDRGGGQGGGPGASTRDAGGGQSSSPSTRDPGGSGSRGSSGGSSAWSGSRNAGMDRSASSRGASSYGGGSRGGGGGGRRR